MMDKITICNWNVRGLGGPTRLQRVKRWITLNKYDGAILCLQELKTSEESATFLLGMIDTGGTVVLDTNSEGKVGAALFIPREFKVTETARKGDGTFAWASIVTVNGTVKVGSVYAPNQRRERMETWRWLTELNAEEHWIVGGDWNMVELWDDARGTSTLIHGGERRAWNKFVDKFNLVDNYLCAGERKGPHYTRQARNNNCLDQSRLDRIYSSA